MSAKMTLKEKQDEIVEEFAFFDDWMDKYDYIISKGKDLAPMDEQYKLESNLIKGCQSNLWLHAEMQGAIIHFSADSDAIIAKGLVALMLEVFNDRTPEEIIQEDIYFIEKIGLKSHLSPTRSNGLHALLKQIKMYALVFSQSVQH